MKTMNQSNRARKTVTIMMVLSMVFTMGYGQGMLIEGVSKIFQSFAKKEAAAEYVVITADYSTTLPAEKETISFKTIHNLFDRSQAQQSANGRLASYTVNNVELTFENELETESWMETSFAENIETTPAVESWMETSFVENIESAPAVESWMETSFAENIESAPSVESWMETSFTENIETAPAVESWMTAPLSVNLEAEVSAESWMTQPLYENNSLEQSIETEDWMTAPLYATSESAITLEGWMTQPLR